MLAVVQLRLGGAGSLAQLALNQRAHLVQRTRCARTGEEYRAVGACGFGEQEMGCLITIRAPTAQKLRRPARAEEVRQIEFRMRGLAP